MPISPKEFIELNKIKPLTKKEHKKGKDTLCIHGTNQPMPWKEVYARIAIGEPIEKIADKYGHVRKIALWALEDEISHYVELGEVFVAEVEQRRKMDNIERANPTVAMTIREAANEYAPDAPRKAVNLSLALLDEGNKRVAEGECTTNDLKNLAEMMQKTTDVLGLTERHASNAGQQLNIQVEGFSIVQDLPPVPEIIDIDVGE